MTPKKTPVVVNKSQPKLPPKPLPKESPSKPPPKPKSNEFKEPLLAFQLKLLFVNNDGSESEVNPLANFTPDDRLRFSFRSNQKGYLYIIRQGSPKDDGEIIFPTMLINDGSNLVSANYEYIIPSNCRKDLILTPRDCALTLYPYSESPEEYFTFIFTREKLVILSNDAKKKRVSLSNFMTAGKLPAKNLVDLIKASGQNLSSQPGDPPFAIRIINVNPKDNNEIIETFVLNKLKQ